MKNERSVPKHDRTYRELKLRNIPHLIRLRSIFAKVDMLRQDKRSVEKYADVGCSNGFVTNAVATRLGAMHTSGFDIVSENLAEGQGLFPDIEFGILDLNTKIHFAETYDVITCFETLEHCGNIHSAIFNLWRMSGSRTSLLITVPVETGLIGTIKFLIKNFVYKDDFDELGSCGVSKKKYFLALITNKRIGGHRDPKRSFWSTHYGFDWRDVVQESHRHFSCVDVKRTFTTVFINASLPHSDLSEQT